jgi:hypothetical protein
MILSRHELSTLIACSGPRIIESEGLGEELCRWCFGGASMFTHSVSRKLTARRFRQATSIRVVGCKGARSFGAAARPHVVDD